MGGSDFDYQTLNPEKNYSMPGEEHPFSDANPVCEEGVPPAEDFGLTALPACPSPEYDNVFYEVQTIGVSNTGDWAAMPAGSFPTTIRGVNYRPLTAQELIDFQRKHEFYQTVCARRGEPHVLAELAKKQLDSTEQLIPVMDLTMEEATTIFAWILDKVNLQSEVGRRGFDQQTLDDPQTLTDERLHVFWSKRERIEGMLAGLQELRTVIEAKHKEYEKLNPRGLPTNIKLERLDSVISKLEVIRDEGTVFSGRGFSESVIHSGLAGILFTLAGIGLGILVARRGGGGGGGGGHGGGGGTLDMAVIMAIAAAAAKAVEAGKSPPAPPPVAPYSSIPTWVLIAGVAGMAAVTVVAVMSPFDGPAGDIVAGGVTLKLGAAALARFGLAAGASAASVAMATSRANPTIRE